MSFRNVHIATTVSIALMLIGVAVTGGDRTDTELQVVVMATFVIGSVVLTLLDWRDDRRGRWR